MQSKVAAVLQQFGLLRVIMPQKRERPRKGPFVRLVPRRGVDSSLRSSPSLRSGALKRVVIRFANR